MNKLLVKKLTDLNRVNMHSVVDENSASIIKNFTKKSIDLLNADFGFAWGKLNSESYKLIYKSSGTPYEPNTREKRDNTHIIPIKYGDHVYGRIVLGYLKRHNLTDEELVLSDVISDSIGRLVTITWLIEKEQKAVTLAEKQKETEFLLEQERSKTEFIANATHELRTPLAIIKGNIDLFLLQNKKKPKSPITALRAIDYEVEHLSYIISDLALLTSEGGRVENRINHDVVNISELINHIVKRLKNVNHKKNISLKTKMEKNILISGDKIYLEKLFSNLIRNAITYGKQDGWIKVDVFKKNNFVEINVSDNGIGIGAEDLPRVFNRFYRVDKSHSSGGKRTGLGLAIVKWITEIHGGEVSAKSLKEKGSVFTVTLPIKATKHKS